MCRKIGINLILIVVAFSINGWAKKALPQKASQDTTIVAQKSADQTVQDFIQNLKSEVIPSKKQKIVSDLLNAVHSETNRYSNIVTENITKILEAEKKSEGKIDPNLITEKDANQALYETWVTYKVALQANYDLFIEKNEEYTCNNVAEQIWLDYKPIVPQAEKVDIDANTKKAVEASIEIAEDLCKYAIDLL